MICFVALAAASEAGYEAGRARRKPTGAERKRFWSKRLWNTYHNARERGLSDRANLEQFPLPGIVPETNGGEVRTPGGSGPQVEGRSAAPGGERP